MASELLKNRALIQKLKEPEIESINFNLADSALDYSVESLEEEILPQPKPQELLDIQEDVRIQRQQDTMDKARPFLMDESIDFIEREEFKKGSNQFGESSRNNPETVEKIVKMFLEEKITAKEIAKRLSISESTVGRILKDENIADFKTRRRFERFSKLLELVEEANRGDKWIAMQDLAKKAGFTGKDQFFYRGLEEFNIPKLENQRDKIKKVFNSIVSNPDTPIKELQSFSKVVANRTGLNRTATNFTLNTLPEYKAFKPILNKIVQPGFQKKAQGMTLGEVGKITEQVKERVPAMTFTSPEKFIMQSAKRHVEKGGDKIKFVKKPGDLDAKGNRITDFDAEFIYKDKKYNFKQLLKEGKKIPEFKEVYKSFDDLNELLSKKVIHPVTKEKTTLKNVMADAYGKGAGYGKGRSSYEIDHFKGVEIEPFSNLRVLPRRINAAAGLIKEMGEQAKLGLLKTEDYTPEKVKSYIKKIGYDFTKDMDALANDELKLAEDILVKNRKLDTPVQIAKKAVFKKDSLSIPIQESGQKKLTALQQLASGKNVGFDPILAGRAGFEEFVKPAAKIGARTAAGAADLLLSAGAGPIGLGVGALIETGQAMPELTRGNIKEAGRQTIIGSLLPEKLVGSMRGDLLKLAETPEEKIAMQNFIDFEKDRKKYESRVKNLKYLQENPFEAEGVDLNILQNKVLKQKADLEERAPKVFFKEFAQEILPTLVRRLDAQNVENLEGVLGSIVGRRGIDDREDIIQDIGAQVVKGEEPFYGQAPVQVSPEELDEIYESGIMAMANGGRIGFADGPDDPSKRTFMKIMAGIASLPILGKFFKSANVAKKVVPLTNTTTTMPKWFPQFVEKALAKGVQTKIDADLMEVKIPELPDVKMEVRTDGKVFVEGKNAYNEPYQIEYEPPGYEVLDYETGKTVKTKGDFTASDTEYRMVGEDDYDVDGVVLNDVDEVLGGSATKLEGFAKGTGEEKYTIGQKRIDEAEALGERADENIPYRDVDPTDFADE